MIKAVRTGPGCPQDIMKAPVKTAPYGMTGLVVSALHKYKKYSLISTILPLCQTAPSCLPLTRGCQCRGNDHQIRLARRGSKHFSSEAGQIPARHGDGNHLDGATRQAKAQRPDGVLAAPVVDLSKGGGHDPLLLQFTSESFFNHRSMGGRLWFSAI